MYAHKNFYPCIAYDEDGFIMGNTFDIFVMYSLMWVLALIL